MKKLMTKTDSGNYPIHIENDFANLSLCLEENLEISNSKVCIITDSNVEKLYLKDIMGCLKDISKEVFSFTFKAGEESKNLSTINDIYTFFLEKRLDRKSVIIALGGGVTGDMAGFAASTYMRGLAFVQIPTTLLAMVDSSCGGKVGIDFMGNKNLIGAFYQPSLVFINVATLNTLKAQDFASGMAEAIKHGLIRDKDYYNNIKTNAQKIKNLDQEALIDLIYGSCVIKSGVVAIDEKETGLREILNFGHTYGHAIESLCSFKIPHGHCVAIGSMSALYLSQRKGNIDKELTKEVGELFKCFALPLSVSGLKEEQILEQMAMDKKTKNNSIDVILLRSLGNAYIVKPSKEQLLVSVKYVIKTEE